MMNALSRSLSARKARDLSIWGLIRSSCWSHELIFTIADSSSILSILVSAAAVVEGGYDLSLRQLAPLSDCLLEDDRPSPQRVCRSARRYAATFRQRRTHPLGASFPTPRQRWRSP